MGSENILTQFEPLFKPRTIAVVGVSRQGTGRQNILIRRLRQFGYDGKIYPIHPSASKVDELDAYPSLAETPEPIDYASIAIPAADIPPLLQASAGRVRFAQIISSGFGEVSTGAVLQQQLVATARAAGIRLIGPNCLGLYSPRGRVTFTEFASRNLGHLGIVSQSGGLGGDIIRQGAARGLEFSGLVTVGNCADLSTSDFVEFYMADPQTRVIGFYVESASDGRRLFQILRAARAQKPIVILKGGLTPHGTRVAASHTGSLTGDYRVWTALARQTGSVLVDTLNGFLNALLIFQGNTELEERFTERIVLFGNGGGTSVLATDYFTKHGLQVLPFDRQTLAALSALALPPGNIIDNPFDCPLGTLQQDDGKVAEQILETICKSSCINALVCHLNVGAFIGRAGPTVLEKLVSAIVRIHARYFRTTRVVLVLRPDGSAEVEALRRELTPKASSAGIPVYPELADAALALVALKHHQLFVRRRRDNVL